MSSALFTLHPLIRVALTTRQADVAQLLIQGLGDNEIARKLGITQSTVKWHLRRLYSSYLQRAEHRCLRILLIRLLLCK